MINDYEATTPMTTDATISGTEMSNEDVVSCLNNLIETAKDGQDGFREAAEGVEDGELRSFFNEASQERAQFVGELQRLVANYGGDPETDGSLLGDIHRGWMDLKAAITGNDAKDILSECERGEDSAVSNYKEALEYRLPSDVLSVVSRQFQAIKARHDQVRSMRDGFAADRSHTAGGLA
jgi:uncharacterized protein (TIGR02284 family)